MTQIQTQSKFGAPPSSPATNLPEPLAGILAAAVSQGATDIHVDTWGDSALLRFRVDAVIREQDPLDIEQARRLFNQLKIAANLEFEATRRPQEGQFRWSDGERSPRYSRDADPRGPTQRVCPPARAHAARGLVPLGTPGPTSRTVGQQCAR